MKNRTIRFKLTAAYALLLTALVLLTFFVMRVVSSSVLLRTTRDYLVAAVEENTDGARFISSADEAAERSVLIEYNGGYLMIDTTFLDVINDVYIALYDSKGTLLYGASPLAEFLDGKPITAPSLYRQTIDNARYDIYERALPVAGTDGLWLRGVLSLSAADAQLKDMTDILLVILPGLLILTVILSYMLAGRLLRPIQKLKNAAASISEGNDLKKRIALDGPKDELHELADTFDAMTARLDKSFESEKRFTSDASHELRTPTSVIMAQCEYTLDKERTAPEYEDALRTIRRQGARMSGLIGDMLDYTRMTSQAERYPFSEIDFSTLAENVCHDLSLIGEKNITLTSEIEEGITILSHAQLLTRLLQNLIMNAYRYGKEGGHTKVKLSHFASGSTSGLNHSDTADDSPHAFVQDSKGTVKTNNPLTTVISGIKSTQGLTSYIQLTVSDNGGGIDEKDLPHIFERFYRSDKSRSAGGTGLGLSIVHQICEMHHATIDVASTLGKGSKFTVRFLDEKAPQTDN